MRRTDGRQQHYREPCAGASVAVDPDLVVDGAVACPLCGRSTKVSAVSGLLRFHRIPLLPLTPDTPPSAVHVPDRIGRLTPAQHAALGPESCLCGCGAVLPPGRIAFSTARCIDRWQKRDFLADGRRSVG